MREKRATVRKPWTVPATVLMVALAGLQVTHAKPVGAADSYGSMVAVSDPVTVDGEYRVVHFPTNRSLGQLNVLDKGKTHEITSFYHWIRGHGGSDLQYLGQAQGDVRVPTDKWLVLEVSKEGWKDLSPLSHLEPDAIHTMRFSLPKEGEQRAMDDVMPHIAHQKGLRSLDLRRTNVMGRGLRHIKNLPNLEFLKLPRGTTDFGLEQVSESRSIEGLYLKESRLTNFGLRHLAKMPQLREIELGGPSNMDNEGLAHLAKLPNLEYLMTWGDHVGDDTLRYIGRMRSLKSLHVGSHPISNAGLVHLVGHQKLERLNLFNSKVTDDGMLYLRELPSLKMLHLGKRASNSTRITDKGAESLRNFTSLEYLDVGGNDMADKGLAYLAEVSNLKHLDLGTRHYTRPEEDEFFYTDKGLESLTKLSKLEEIFVASHAITDRGLAHLGTMSSLKHLTVWSDSISNDGIAELDPLKSLTYLGLYSSSISLAGLAHVNTLTELRELRLHRTRQDGSGLNISGLTNLEEISLTLGSMGSGRDLVNDQFRDEDLACLANLTGLKELQLYPLGGISDAGMRHLAGLTNMNRLGLGGKGVTDQSLSYLSNMKRLYLLTVTGNFTDRGLRHLEGLDALTNLTINSETEFGDTAMRHLRNELPNLRQLRTDRSRQMSASGNSPNKTARKGTNAPEFMAKTIEGTPIQLADYRGKTVLLYFWATWCKPCLAATPALKNAYAELSRYENFEMISLSMDDSYDKVKRHVNLHGLDWPQVRVGRHSKIAADYGVNGAPHYVLIGPDGKVLLNNTNGGPQLDRALWKSLGIKS